MEFEQRNLVSVNIPRVVIVLREDDVCLFFCFGIVNGYLPRSAFRVVDRNLDDPRAGALAFEFCDTAVIVWISFSHSPIP